MQSYGLRGTPSLSVIDEMKSLRGNHFGSMSDLQMGHQVANFLSERRGRTADLETDTNRNVSTECDEQGCPVF